MSSAEGAGFDGSGVTIAVMGQSDVLMTDIAAFRAAAGLPANNPTVVVPPGDKDPGIRSASGDEGESDLDLEWAGGIARNANILFVTASATQGNGVVDSITYAIDNNVAPVMSISYGECEADESASDFKTLNSLYAQANAQGMTVVAASGDVGAAGCDTGKTETAAIHGLAVDFPASSQYVTGVGGTSFTTGNWSSSNNSYGGSALGYFPEQVWNDGFQAASGGGASTLVAKPTWQTGPGVPADSARDVPDVAFTASPQIDPLLICSEGSCTNGFQNQAGDLDVTGGTSASAPPFAGLLALIIQMHGSGSQLGNINPNLYSLAQISNNAFHDVVSGNNEVACTTGTPDCPNGGTIGFSAGPGYDQTTGLGSVDAYNLAEEWYGDFQLTASPASVVLNASSSVSATINVVGQDNFAGNVTFTCSVASALEYVTCSVPSTVVTGSGSTTVTITAGSLAGMPRRTRPPWGRGWQFGAALLCLVALSSVLFMLKSGTAMASLQSVIRSAGQPWLLYASGSAMLLVIAIGAVSCGGGSSGSSGGGSNPTPLSISCNLPAATVGSVYSGSCTANNGVGTLTYSVASGTLPAGLTLSASTGFIAGTPTASGSSALTIQVTDSSSPQQSATQANTIVVGAATLAVSCTVETPINAGAAYSGNCTATGGTSPVTYSISSGTLPPGLTLNASTGAITGIPTTAGTYGSITVMATDSGSPAQKATAQIAQITILAVQPLSVNCLLGDEFEVGRAFSNSCIASGGTVPYQFAVTAGALPTGVSLNPVTGAITGTPTVSNQNNFVTITATDSGKPPQTANSTLPYFVAPPQGGNGLVTITATSGGIVKTVTVSVYVPAS